MASIFLMGPIVEAPEIEYPAGPWPSPPSLRQIAYSGDRPRAASVVTYGERREEKISMISGGMVTVYVTDMERALRFYTGILDLELAYRAGPGWAVVEAPDGFSVGLHDAMGSAPVGESGSATVGFHVDGPLAEVVAELEERGVEFLGGLTEDTAVPLAYFRDPDGNRMYLAEDRSGGRSGSP